MLLLPSHVGSSITGDGQAGGCNTITSHISRSLLLVPGLREVAQRLLFTGFLTPATNPLFNPTPGVGGAWGERGRGLLGVKVNLGRASLALPSWIPYQVVHDRLWYVPTWQDDTRGSTPLYLLLCMWCRFITIICVDLYAPESPLDPQ